MKFKSVSTIAAIICGCFLAFAASLTAFAAAVPPAQTAPGTQTNDSELSEEELQRQFDQEAKNYNELYSTLQTLRQTPGATKEQIDQASERLERSKENIQRLEKQLIERRTEIDIKGKVVDEDGNPLDDVSLTIRYELLTVPDNTWKNESRMVNGEFGIKKKGFNDRDHDLIDKVELTFIKEGYYHETLRFHSGFGFGDKENTMKQPDLRVVMQKSTPRAALSSIKDKNLEYNLVKKEKTYCDLSDFVASEEEKTPRVRMVTIPLDEKPEAGKYLELDFLRDEHGGIVTREFPDVVNGKGESPRYPAVYIFRLHSDDPEDGMIVMEDGGYRKDHPFNGKPIDYLEYEKIEKEERKILTEQNKKRRPLERRPEAPKDGYTLREISIPVEEMLLIKGYADDGRDKSFWGNWRGGYRWMWIRCGNHYGKFSVAHSLSGSASVDSGALNEKFKCAFRLELYMNRKPGDTNLRN